MKPEDFVNVTFEKRDRTGAQNHKVTQKEEDARISGMVNMLPLGKLRPSDNPARKGLLKRMMGKMKRALSIE